MTAGKVYLPDYDTWGIVEGEADDGRLIVKFVHPSGLTLTRLREPGEVQKRETNEEAAALLEDYKARRIYEHCIRKRGRELLKRIGIRPARTVRGVIRQLETIA